MMPDGLFLSLSQGGQALPFGGGFDMLGLRLGPALGLGLRPAFRWSGAAPDPVRSRQIQGEFPAHTADGFL
jgi:hypothetical protein